MSPRAHDRVERVIADNYESLKAEVLGSVRAKLAGDSLRPDPSELDAAYNTAWHALYEQLKQEPASVSNLGGWLTTITYRRVIDEVRAARMKHRAPADAGGETVAALGYEHNIDAEIASRQKYHQWLMSVRLRLNEREQQAVSLCVLHEHSRRDASEIMGIELKRLDKIMVTANKKLGGLLESINRGEWCQEQRSLIKAYAFRLHEEGGEREQLAVAHLMECQACAAYVRSLRGLAGVVPAPVLGGAAGASGGVIGWLGGLFASSGAAAGGAGAGSIGGAALLGGIGVKTAALCTTVVCAVGGAFVLDNLPDSKPGAPTRSAPAPVSRAIAPDAVRAGATRGTAASTTGTPGATRSSRSARKRAAPDPRSKGAQQEAEFGIEPDATNTSITPGASTAAAPRPPVGSEFGIEGP